MNITLLLCSLLLLGANGLAGEPEKWALMQRAVLETQDLNTVRTLVKSGLDPNAPIGCGTFAPLDGAISKGNLEMLTLLLSLGAKPTDRQMVRAVSAPTPVALPMVKLLLAAGASVNARDYYSRTEDRFTNPIHAAVYKGDRELIGYLLSQKGIELDNSDVDDRTPLMIAIEKEDGQVVDMLLAAHADPSARNKEGLDAAAVASHVIETEQAFKKKLASATTAAVTSR